MPHAVEHRPHGDDSRNGGDQDIQDRPLFLESYFHSSKDSVFGADFRLFRYFCTKELSP
jgi:hypothetical protein